MTKKTRTKRTRSRSLAVVLTAALLLTFAGCSDGHRLPDPKEIRKLNTV
jgi:hypothetical protein